MIARPIHPWTPPDETDPDRAAELDRLETWQKYSSHMCGGCMSSCCTLPVEVKIKDLIRIGIVDEFERGEPAKNIAKRLQKEGIVERYNQKSEIFTLQRMSNNDCLYLDRKTRLARTPAVTIQKSGHVQGIAPTSPSRRSARRQAGTWNASDPDTQPVTRSWHSPCGEWACKRRGHAATPSDLSTAALQPSAGKPARHRMRRRYKGPVHLQSQAH